MAIQCIAQDFNGLSNEEIMRACPSVFANEPHESRSSKYAYISTGTILDVLRKEGLVPTTAMQSKTRSVGHQAYTNHLLRLCRIEDLGYRKSEVHEVVVGNSYNGTKPYRLYNGFIRIACENGAVTGDIDSSMRVYHRGRDIVREVVESTLAIVKESEQVMRDIEIMKQIELSRPEQLLLAQLAMKARFDVKDEEDEEGNMVEGTLQEIPYRPEDFLVPERKADWGNDLFTIYMRLQEHAIKGGVQGQDRKKRHQTSRMIAGIDQSIHINQLLWQLTKGMMKLKTGEA